MKKITLLFMILCAGKLHGMDNPEHSQVNWGKLPDDVKPLVIMDFVENGDNLDAVINNIKEFRLINKTLYQIISKKYDNQPGFTKLMHMLADKFNTTSWSVAEQFKTLVSKKYLEFTGGLMMSVYNGNNDKMIYFINQGADINQTIDYPIGLSQRELRLYPFEDMTIQFDTPLLCAFSGGNIELIKLLLSYGANSNHKYNKAGLTLLDCTKKLIPYANEHGHIEMVNSINQLIQILEEAMKKITYSND